MCALQTVCHYYRKKAVARHVAGHMLAEITYVSLCQYIALDYKGLCFSIIDSINSRP